MNRFGETARGLAQNPLGIIALFIVLVYGFASLVVGIGANLDPTSTIVLVWFMVLFPVLVLGVFAWLVSRHHWKLYSPRDYGKGEFLQAAAQAHPGLQNLPVVRSTPSQQSPTTQHESLSTQPIPSEQPSEEFSREALNPATLAERIEEREQLYKHFRGVFIVHVLAPSVREEQDYDIFLYLKRHRDEPISDVTKAEFFFGRHWGNRIYEGQREGDIIGLRLSAYGPFLCTCLVTFDDGKQVSLYRYIDFEMGEVIAEVAAR
jgi:hypothetical protein